MVDYREGTLRERKARVSHKCAECQQGIEKGEIYIRSSYRLNGKYFSIARHVECVGVATLTKQALMTEEGFPLFLSIGFGNRPRVWVRFRGMLRRSYPVVYERLLKSGLDPIPAQD